MIEDAVALLIAFLFGLGMGIMLMRAWLIWVIKQDLKSEPNESLGLLVWRWMHERKQR